MNTIFQKIYLRFLFGMICLGSSFFFYFYMPWYFIFSTTAYAESNPVLSSNVPKESSYIQSLIIEKKRKKRIFSALEEAKFYLINGNIPKAKRLFEKIKEESIFSKIISSQYLAYTAFIENRFSDALFFLESKELKSDYNYKKNCFFKIINLLFAKKKQEFLSELKKCKEFNTEIPHDRYLWIESLLNVNLDESGQSVLNTWELQTREPHKLNPEKLRLLLKLILYTNQEYLIKNIIYGISQESLEDSEIRELLGFIYYRLKDDVMALNFIDDISTPNAENIKGNIQLQKKAYEVAYGHFQLALQKKQNSLNAVERALPLAWKLQKWQEGHQLISMMKSQDTLEKEKKALTSMFLTMNQEPNKVAIILDDLIDKFQGQLPFEVAQIKSYNALQLEQMDSLKKYSLSACIQGDGLNCWLLFQLYQWENFPKTLKRDEKIIEHHTYSLQWLKEKQELEPIVEDLFINQKEIEEMDQDSFELQY